MHDEPFGPRLRAERERRRITLESIAANTKISISLLRDLENDRIKHWPGGIFRRSFLKSYAAAIGLDPEDALREFLARFPDQSSAAEMATIDRPPESGVEAASRPPLRAPRPMLRLTLADEPRVFSAETVVKAFTARLLAVLLDMAVPAALAAIAWWVVGSFWAPFAVAISCYLVVGVVVLGNTPGIFLQAARANARVKPASPASVGADAGHLSILEESLIR